MDLLLKVRPGQVLIHDLGRCFQPLSRGVVLVKIILAIRQAKPRRRRIGEHPMQGRGHQLGRMDSSAVEDQLGTLVTRRAFLRDVGFARNNVVRDLLPVRLPVRPLRPQRGVPLHQSGSARIINH